METSLMMDGVERRKQERREQEARRKNRNADGKKTLIDLMKRLKVKSK